jgi:hypothetical protein
LLSTQATGVTFSTTTEKAPPFVGKTNGWWAVAAIAVGQACGSATAAQQQTLLALGTQDQGLGAVGWAVRHFGGMPAAAQMMRFTGLDQANFGEDWERIIGHGWACAVRMDPGEGMAAVSRIASGLRALLPSPACGA